MALEGNFSQFQRIPQAQGVPIAPGWDFSLQSLIQSCLMAQPRASPQIPAQGLREAAEEGRLEAEGAVPLQSHGIPSLGAGGLGHGRFWVVSGKPWIHWRNLAEMAVRHKTRAAKVAVRFVVMSGWEGLAWTGWHPSRMPFPEGTLLQSSWAGSGCSVSLRALPWPCCGSQQEDNP